MPISKLLLAVILPALMLGCATIPSTSVSMQNVEPTTLQTARDNPSNQPSNAVPTVLTGIRQTPIQYAGLTGSPLVTRPGQIPTVLTGTFFETIPVSYSQETVPTALGTPASYSTTAVYGAPGTYSTPTISPGMSAGGPADPNQTGGPVFWILPEEQGGNPPSVVLNDGPLRGDAPQGVWQTYGHPVWQNLLSDERNFYSCCSLEWLAAGVGGAAILANTNLDEQFRQAVHGPGGAGSTDLNWMKGFGTGTYVIPALAGIWAVDYWLDESGPVGSRPYASCLEEWSGRSLRGLIVGAVPLLSLQYITGGSRPGESSAGSHWKPFQDNNGVSGHAFVGAVPFWTAAQMTDCVPLEIGFYGMGTLAGISRIHTDSHYLSQVLLGWWIAGLSVAAVDCTEMQKRQWLITPTMFDNGAGITVMHQW
ncbi:MAG TPA: phosphatase PAP2 family protein [Pirellulales bacterium]